MFGMALFFLIGTLMASDIVAHQNIKSPPVSWYDLYGDLPERDIDHGLISDFEIAENYSHSMGTIYLTFDDGPSEFTGALLDTLKNYGVKATFFVTGRGDDEIIKREHDEGHTVALHTFSHNYANVYASVENYFADLNQIADRVKNLTGEDAKLIRFPGGSSNLVSARYDGPIKIMSILTNEVEARGYQYFDWNVDSDDAGRARDADTVFSNVASHLKPGDNVVLQHDVKDYSVAAVGKIIEYGNANGYNFKPLTLDSFTAHHGVNN